MATHTSILVGTAKGLFVVSGDGRQRWEVSGPFLRGQALYAVAWERSHDRPRILAGGHSEHWGPSVVWSDDLGATWDERDGGSVRFPPDVDAAVRRIWQLHPADDGVVWAGVEPAALFRSADRGVSFELVRGLWEHPHRPQWTPGGGGLCLHTVLLDPSTPERLWVAISTGGVYRSDDGGVTWQARNRGIATPFLPGDEPPEFGQCVHKMALHPAVPDRLFLQHHWGVYRSDDGGDGWNSVGRALPSDFGFPLVVHPDDPDTVFVIPLESDEFRVTPEGRCRVYRSSDGGGSWSALTDGLPQRDAYLTVLRDAFAASVQPVGLFFGTRTGELFGSVDGGERWSTLVRHLPPVLSVRPLAMD
ncbi:MAG TPA: hypothetical protein VG452_11930 [Egibacteraceae bacterium]|nr:exo-alpha-sialidase [Actinomycetota bacterium]HWB72915.1 hypothetical protein [Egibacteraceae bacterium]